MAAKVKPVPEGYHTVTPYLTVKGVDQLIEFLKKAFGAKEQFRHKRPDGSTGHAEMKLGDSMLMMGEAYGQWVAMPSQIYLYVEDCDKVYKQAMAAGATSLMEPADQFYGDRNAGVKDPLGNSWWIGTHVEDVSPEEMKRRAAKLGR
jgi:PhnB protein